MSTQLEEMEVICRDVGRTIKGALPPDVGFTLVLGTFGESGWMTYLASVERTSAIAMLRELLERLEAEARMKTKTKGD